VTNRLEVGGQLAPVSLGPGAVRLASPSVYARYQFPVGKVTLTPSVQAVYPLASSDSFFVDVAVEASYDVSGRVAVDVSPTLSLDTRADGAGTSVTVPVEVERQVGEQLSLQLASGVGFSRLEPRFGLSRRSESYELDDATVPLTAQVEYSLRRGRARGPLADVTLQWQWPQLYAREPGRSGVHANDWTLRLQSSWYAIP
jgi:hypothetical protein